MKKTSFVYRPGGLQGSHPEGCCGGCQQGRARAPRSRRGGGPAAPPAASGARCFRGRAGSRGGGGASPRRDRFRRVVGGRARHLRGGRFQIETAEEDLVITSLVVAEVDHLVSHGGGSAAT